MLFGCNINRSFIAHLWKIRKSYPYNNAIRKNILRKELLSPVNEIGFEAAPPKCGESGRKRASFFASLRAGLTVEAAIAVPLFILCMLGMLHYIRVMETAVRFSNALCQTAEQMAVTAYAAREGTPGAQLPGGLSVLYARSRVMKLAGNTSAVQNVNFFMSSIGEEDELINLTAAYRVRPFAGGVQIPWLFFIQKGCVRAWTGRSGSDGKGTGGGETSGNQVYVTEHGSVYHTDSSCSHIRLSIRQVKKNALGTMRNSNGGKYHACELCGKAAGSNVYITKDGDRYHSSLQCSGLKRTVKSVSEDDVKDMRPCSKCAAGHRAGTVHGG